MKAESNIPPRQIAIESHDGLADVVLTENVTLVDKEGAGFYQYDQYRVTVRSRPNLQADVEAHFADWLAYAKGEISKSKLVTANQTDIADRLKVAIEDNKAYLALVAPTTAQNTAEIKRLARQNNRLIRYLLKMFDSAE